LQNNDFDFVKEFFKVAQPSKADMINRYITGKITKQQLDEFMEKLAPKD
jgi:hypothetical protein